MGSSNHESVDLIQQDSVHAHTFSSNVIGKRKRGHVNVSITIIGSTYMKTGCFFLFILAFYVDMVRGSLCSGSESTDDYYWPPYGGAVQSRPPQILQITSSHTYTIYRLFFSPPHDKCHPKPFYHTLQKPCHPTLTRTQIMFDILKVIKFQ